MLFVQFTDTGSCAMATARIHVTVFVAQYKVVNFIVWKSHTGNSRFRLPNYGKNDSFSSLHIYIQKDGRAYLYCNSILSWGVDNISKLHEHSLPSDETEITL